MSDHKTYLQQVAEGGQQVLGHGLVHAHPVPHLRRAPAERLQSPLQLRVDLTYHTVQ